jgi:CBS domain-containing protein
MDSTSERVNTNMTVDVVWVSPDESIKNVYNFMTKNNIRHIPVISYDQLVGIISDRDIFKVGSLDANSKLVLPIKNAGEVMTSCPVTCNGEEKISKVAKLMIDKKIDCLPVVSSFRSLKGLITSTDLMKLLKRPETVDTDSPIPYEFRVCNMSNWFI